MEVRFGSLADAALAYHGVVTDQNSRSRLIEALFHASNQAARKLERNAGGDYRPDPDASRFPAWAPKDGPKHDGSLTITGLFERWAREALALGRTKKTVSEYRSLIERFVAFLRHDDALKITHADVVRWKDMRLAKGLSARTVSSADLVTLNSVFGWAEKNALLPANPAKNVALRVVKKREERSKGFTDEEARDVLKAALAYSTSAREHPKTGAAKRWSSWVCAYTGARIGEVLQLRRSDLSQKEDHWVMRITPEAGTTKDKKWREVPLHPHLIEIGFAEFVEASPEGYLFVNCPRGTDVLGPLQGVKNRVAEFVREVVSDKRVAPNHAWRHRFKTVGIDAGIPERVLDAICGHAPRTVGETYGEVRLKAKIDAVSKLLRYKVK
jgi:integrase